MATVPEPWSQNNEEGTRCARRKRCGKCQRCAQWMLETTAREHTVAYEHSFGKTNPALITLGYQARDGLAPSDWLDIDRKAWLELKRRWKKRWDAMPPHLWSLQWTRLQVPHRHIVLPSSATTVFAFREWLLQTWASIIGGWSAAVTVLSSVGGPARRRRPSMTCAGHRLDVPHAQLPPAVRRGRALVAGSRPRSSSTRPTGASARRCCRPASPPAHRASRAGRAAGSSAASPRRPACAVRP